MTDLNALDLNELPPMPQGFDLRRLAQALWQQDGVVALWLGGGIARGMSDNYSDIDLRLCVSEEVLEQWKPPDFARIYAEEVVGSRTRYFGPILFFQSVLSSSVIVDLTIQMPQEDPGQDYVIVLGCRDPEFRRRLVSTEPVSAYAPTPADPVVVRQIITDFWIDSLKAPKVLFRGLDLIALNGLQIEHAVILRLWHILATGTDTGAQRPTIHGLTPVVRQVEALLGDTGQVLLGLPLQTRADLCAATEANREEVARVGRLLSALLGFFYPVRLEDTVRTNWAEFLEVTAPGTPARAPFPHSRL